MGQGGSGIGSGGGGLVGLHGVGPLRVLGVLAFGAFAKQDPGPQWSWTKQID